MTFTTTLTDEMAHQLDVFAARLLTEREARIRAEYPNSPHMWGVERVEVKPGKLYTKVNAGPGEYLSGVYMVEHATGTIFGIKGYGQVHRGHRYGTLDTIDNYDWSGYTGRRKDGGA